MYPKPAGHPPLYTDVGLIALEIVLSQVHSGQECVIAYFHEVWHGQIQYAIACICHPPYHVSAGSHDLRFSALPLK